MYSAVSASYYEKDEAATVDDKYSISMVDMMNLMMINMKQAKASL